MDIGGSGPGSPIHASLTGVVRFAQVADNSLIDGGCPAWGYPNGGFGNCVIVRTGRYACLYGHLSSINVTQGQSVQQGAVLGIEGSSGNATGTHLHFSVWDYQQGGFIDPASVLPARADLPFGNLSLITALP